MPNHFHLVVETPQANLVAGMKWFLGTYTSRFNRQHKLFERLPLRQGGALLRQFVGAKGSFAWRRSAFG